MASLDFKLKKTLTLFGCLLFALLARVWFLSVINYEKMHKLSVLPRRKIVTLAPSRGLITTQDKAILATSRRRFDVAICYQDIKQIPAFELTFDKGVKIKHPKRKIYIQDLAHFLKDHIGLESSEIEDFIYAKAALFQDTSLILKEDISEKSYHILRLAQKDWPGLKIMISESRFYPHSKLGCHLVGYLGAIDPSTYKKAQEEKKLLKDYIEAREQGHCPPLPVGYSNPLEVRERFDELSAKGYNLQDLVGKDGIEKSFDQLLRGGCGKKFLEVTRLGQVLSELPGSYEPTKPSSIELSIDLTLQEKAESLLAERESNDELFAKGGACVVIDLKSSKILALASYPRFNPQDFIDKNTQNIHKWSESTQHIKRLYEGIEEIEKEKFSSKLGFFTSKLRLSYKHFLERLLSPASFCLNKLMNNLSVKDAFLCLDSFEKLHEKLGFIEPSLVFEELKKQPHLDEETLCLFEPVKKLTKDLQDPVLFLDLLKLQIDTKKFSPKALACFSDISLEDHFTLTQDIAILSYQFEKILKKTFDLAFFESWKKDHFKAFLKTKRQLEEKKGTWARPYTDYLEEEKSRQFKQFLARYKKYFIAYLLDKIPKIKDELLVFSQDLNLLKKHTSVDNLKKHFGDCDLEQLACALKAFRSFEELSRPLYGHYPRLLEAKKHQEKDLALAFYPKYKLGYLKSNAYRCQAPQGSVFKIAVAYQALKERLLGKGAKLPIISDTLGPATSSRKDQILGYDEKNQVIKRWHKGGLLPRSSHGGIGKVDVVSALEQSSNIYFSLLASDYIQNPQELITTAQKMGLGLKTCLDLPYEACGKLPGDIGSNKTGLYAFAIGQHEFLVTPLQTARMIGSLFSDGELIKPQIVSSIKRTVAKLDDLFESTQASFLETKLSQLGCFFPLFTETRPKIHKNISLLMNKEIQDHYMINEALLHPIKKGLDKVLWGDKGTARAQAIATLLPAHEMAEYMKLKHLLIGKTGTAEQRVLETLDAEASSRMLNHIWFAAVSFEDVDQKHPELAICVYLKDGKLGGKEAAPIAAKLVQFYKNL